MARLPVVASDGAAWGGILNTYLGVEHSAGGQHTLSPSSTYIRGDGTVAQIGPTFYNAESYGFTRGADNAAQLATVLTAMTAVPGTLYLPGGAWPYSTAGGLVIPKTACGLIGEGWATVLMPTHNVGTHAISNHISTNHTTDPNASALRFADFQLDCSNMTSGAFDGIHLDSYPGFVFTTSDYKDRYYGTTTALSGTGSVQTYTIPSTISQNKAVVGDTVTITGALPAGYNGTYTVTAVSGGIPLTTFSVAGATTGAQTQPGFVQNTGGHDGGGFDADIKTVIDNVMVKNAPQDSFSAANEGGHLWTRCHSLQSIRYGFNPTVDSQVIGCQSSSAGSAGFLCDSTGLEVLGCKSFYSGWQSSTNGHGFYVLNAGSSGGIMIVGCDSQDNRKHGYEVVDSENIHIIGCTADSNSGTFNNYVAGGYGVDLFSVHHSTIDVHCMDRNDSGLGVRQGNAIQVRGGSYDNKIRITHSGSGGTHATIQGGGPGATVGGATAFGTPIVPSTWDTASTPNTVEINGSAGQQQQPYSLGTTSALSTASSQQLYTITSTAGLVVGDKVTVTGATPSGFNVSNATVTEVTSATVFKVAGTTAGPQTVAGTVTITTPIIDPTEGGRVVFGTLSGTLNIGPVANGNYWPGQLLRFTWVQDATGGRTVNWDAQYHLAGGAGFATTANKVWVVEFEWDHTLTLYREQWRST